MIYIFIKLLKNLNKKLVSLYKIINLLEIMAELLEKENLELKTRIGELEIKNKEIKETLLKKDIYIQNELSKVKYECKLEIERYQFLIKQNYLNMSEDEISDFINYQETFKFFFSTLNRQRQNFNYQNFKLISEMNENNKKQVYEILKMLDVKQKKNIFLIKKIIIEKYNLLKDKLHIIKTNIIKEKTNQIIEKNMNKEEYLNQIEKILNDGTLSDNLVSQIYYEIQELNTLQFEDIINKEEKTRSINILIRKYKNIDVLIKSYESKFDIIKNELLINFMGYTNEIYKILNKNI